MAEEEPQDISIEDLELSLEVYEIEAEEKLKKLQELFVEKGVVDLSKMFYEEKSSLQIKFQNIISDLTEFLINQEIASTDKLRKTFYRIIENPLNMAFKVSRFEIFKLRLDAFDIQLEPIDAICQLGASILSNIDKYDKITEKLTTRTTGGEYKSFDEFLEDAQSRLIQDLIFTFYSYLRKGGSIIKKEFENKVRVVELYNKIQSKVIKRCVTTGDVKTLKELSILNYELYLIQNSYDVLCFYLKVPFKANFAEVFKELQTLGQKAIQNSNFNLFILIFLRYSKEILVKIDREGIDPEYSSYIEQALNAILELWGCRLCYHQQFFDIFKKLISLHPNKSEALLNCLKFNPQLKKDDIVLLRVNFKHEILQKQSELLSLLKPKTVEEINGSLSALYHQTLYNLDFKDYNREQILQLVNLLNGNSSLGELFGISERAFKEWNHSIDFTNPLKYIGGEFKFPAIEESKLLESIRLLNNLCIFQAKSPKDYEQLIKAGSIQKSLYGFVSFLFSNEKGVKFVTDNELVKIFLVNNLLFLKRISLNSEDWEPLCLLYSASMGQLSEPYISQVISIVKDIVADHFDSFSIRNVITLFKNIVSLEEKLKLPSASATLESIINSFMRGTQKQNDQIKFFRFFDSKISDSLKMTKSEETFLKQNACLNGEVIEPKNLGCFTLSELQIITNPVQFDKVMDNYYFSLDKNAKRFIQYLTVDWVESKGTSSNISILKELISKYPIAIPLLCSTRLTFENSSSRFIELLVREISEESFDLVNKMIECRCIRYRNGRDYVREEIVPIILKQTIKKSNEGVSKVEHYELLAHCLSISWPSDLKMDLIQNSIQAIKHEITQSKEQSTIYRLSNAHNDVLKRFFQKKEVDMRKKGLKDIFEQQIWNENRIKLCSLDNQNQIKSVNKAKISEQIMITPYMTPQDFDTESIKLEKITNFQRKTSESADLSIATLQHSLPVKGAAVNLNLQKKSESFTTVDFSKLKYNIESHLGQEIKHFCRRQGFKIVTNSSDPSVQIENAEQNITFVQYYLKQFQIPEISADLVFRYLKALLQDKLFYCSLFSNVNNMKKLFASLICLLNFYSKDLPSPSPAKTIIDELLSINLDNRTQNIKNIIKILSDIGYTNLWAESFNSLKEINYLKQLKEKTGFKEESEEETFFSWVLRICLQNQAMKQDFNTLLGQIFRTRPKDQNALMYKVSLNRGELNLIMKSLQIENLSYVSLLFHSNYNNLRLYTDQLHEGLKALGMSSKNRAYNEYVQLSKDLEDEQFYTPMKLFKENFSFFITIEKEGYKFKREEEEKIGRERVLKVLRSGVAGDQLNVQIEKVIEDFEVELEKLQHNIASRVKAFYLATKLRDLSYQNSITICLLYEILSQSKTTKEGIMEKIQHIEIFSLMMKLYNELVRFQQSPSCDNFLLADRPTIEKEVNICSTRRYSHAMSKVYEKIDLQLDEVIQRCIDVLKYFFSSKLGQEWIDSLQVYPPFLSKSFVGSAAGEKLATQIRENINKTNEKYEVIEISISDKDEYTNLIKSIRELKKGQILTKNALKIKIKEKIYNLSELLTPLRDHLVSSETLSKSKDGFLLFNKYKTSQKTLEEIELLGIIVGYCVYHNIQMDLPLHSSLLAALGFSICDLHDLLDVDFRIWEDLRNVMSVAESKDLNLNFSYIFQSLLTLKQERVELTDKGTSKKVNNLNREEYCDQVSCYLLYKTVSKQIFRFLEAACYICPKELFSSLKITELHRLFIKKFLKYSESILRQHMRKRGLVLPDTVLSKGKRIQNLKDYQSIQWLCEVVEENPQIKEKIWRNEQNIFVCTWMGQGVEFDSEMGVLLIGRLKNKDELKQSLSRLK